MIAIAWLLSELNSRELVDFLNKRMLRHPTKVSEGALTQVLSLYVERRSTKLLKRWMDEREEREELTLGKGCIRYLKKLALESVGILYQTL